MWVVKIFFITPAQIVECVAIDTVQQPIQRTATSPSLRDLGDPVFLRVSLVIVQSLNGSVVYKCVLTPMYCYVYDCFW